ncbi:MAG TPA: thioredoxin [Armatimonadota bacterium]|nr:thioredoxin [Armatimonadota bacterium]
MTGTMQEVTDASFQKEVLEANQPVLVDFWAPWCGPCRALSPIVEQLASENGAAIKFVKVNVDDSPRVAETYRIQGIPTLMLFKNGQRAGEMVGLQKKDAIQQKLNDLRAA